MNKANVQAKSDASLNFAIKDLIAVIEIQETFENPTFMQKAKLAQYHRDLLLCATEKALRNNLKNPVQLAWTED